MWPWRKQGEQGDGPEPDRSGPVPENIEQTGPEAGAEGDSFGSGGEIQERIGQLEAELEDARGRALRVMADFQNYQRRALQNEVVARQQGVAALATGVVGVLDHLDQAVNQDVANASAEQILAGVRVIRDELLKALQGQGVGIINPAPNELFVP